MGIVLILVIVLGHNILTSYMPQNEILAHLLSAKSPAECDLVEAILARTGLPSAQDPIAVPFFHGLKWLGLTTSEEAPLASTPLDTLCATLEKKMMYAEDERDMVFLQHKYVFSELISE